MTKEKLAIKLAIDIMERNVSKYINHGIYEVSDTDGAVHVEFAEAINILNEMLEQQPCEDAVSREPRKIDEWDIKGKTAELWIVNGKLQIRYQGTIHNTDLPSVTPKDDVLDKIRAEIEQQEKWLMDAGYNQYNVDIAFNAVKLAVDKYKADKGG